MKLRRRIGRRRFDRIVLALALVGVFALLAYMGACDSKGPSIPDPVVTQPEAPTAISPAPEVVVISPQATPDPSLPIIAVCNKATGICTFESDKLRPVDAVCTYPGQTHPIWGTWSAAVDDGDTVDVRDICTDVPGVDEERCVPITKPVQVDFHGAGRHIGHLGPIYNLTFPATLSPEECERCIEFEEPVVTRDLVCEDEVQESPREGSCFVDCELTITHTWKCREPDVRTRPHRKPVDCPPVCDEQETFGFNKLTGDECEPVCLPPEEITLSWEGPGDPETECAAFGDYVPAGDANPLFWICKAGTDREVWLTFPDGDTCRNGKDVSHVRACVCEVDD